MFEQFPVAIDALKGSTDAARLVDAAVDWAKVGAAADAQRFALIAEFATLALADAGDDTCLWWVDEEDDVVAEIGAAFGISRRWAMADLEIGAAMRERFPRLAELFHRGEISAKVMATVVDRTLLVTDPDALAAIDAACVEAAVLCGWSGLSFYKLKNAVDVWVHRHDPTAVRRARDKVRDRSFTVRADQDGTSTVCIQMSTPGAALLTGRLRKMAKAVCKDDPRTLDQRMVDALEALAVDANHLKCLCGSPTCPATAEDGVASRYLVHIYAEAGALDVEPDPLIHGADPRDQPPRPAGDSARTTTANPTAAPTSDTSGGAEAAEPADAEGADGEPAAPAVADGEPAADSAESATEAAESIQDTEPATESDEAPPKPSRPPQCPAPAPTAEPTAEDQPEPQRAAATTAAAATPTPRVCPPTGVIPGYGIVTAPLLAALLAGGAEVRHMKAPAIDPEDHYRPSTTLADFLRGRDLTCRFPGCDTPIDEADLAHTVPWADGGPTHA
ncbi:HNH endonuclease signature motif containing protein [soil metagenome]